MVKDEMSLSEDCGKSLHEAMQAKQADLDKIANLTGVVTNLQSELANLHAKESLKANKDNSSQQAGQLQNPVEQLQSEVKALTKDRDYLDAKYADAVQEVQQLTEELTKSLDEEQKL